MNLGERVQVLFFFPEEKFDVWMFRDDIPKNGEILYWHSEIPGRYSAEVWIATVRRSYDKSGFMSVSVMLEPGPVTETVRRGES